MFKDATNTPLDELVDQGQALGHSPERVAEHLRTYQRLRWWVSPAMSY